MRPTAGRLTPALATIFLVLGGLLVGGTTLSGCTTVRTDKGKGGGVPGGKGGDDQPGASATKAPTAIAVGSGHSCAVRGTGGVSCWGANDEGQLGDGTLDDRSSPVPVANLADAVEVVAGRSHTCARKRSGAVVCWGANDRGQLGSGMDTASRRPIAVRGLGDAVALAAGDDHTCAVRESDAVVCWGANQDGQLGNLTRNSWNEPAQIRGLTDAVGLAAGSRHTCARRKSGGVICWGANEKGQLGDGGTKGHERPSVVAQLPAVQGLSAGGSRTCAHTRESVLCWGDDGAGRTVKRPAAVAKGSAADPIAEVEVALHHACVRFQSGAARCWGENQDGRLGDGSTQSRKQPAPVSVSQLADLGLGDRHSCGLRSDGKVLCWGDDAAGALGRGDAAAQPAETSDGPRAVRKVASATDVASGDGFSCALTQAGEVMCWGRNDLGQLGRPTGKDTFTADPAPIPDLDAVSIAAGPNQVCAARREGAVVCWGDNPAGQLGRPGAQPIRRPQPVTAAKITNAVEVAVGSAHGCARLEDGKVTCWGDDSEGQLGDGVGDRGGKVSGLSDATMLDAGRAHTCALKRTGAVVCWGANNQGQIGNSASAAALKTPVQAPIAVVKLPNAVEISVGPEHGCARKSDGTVACWGHNMKSELGSGTASGVWTSRVPVKGVKNAAALDVGIGFACVLSSKRLMCWGDNAYGQAGFAGDFSPTARQGLSGLDATQLALGRDHGCARMRNGEVRCWGDDAKGQLGDGGRASSATPAEVPL
ncbi:RCC1 domain-containing protein [Plesiocystis pacifica]|uniref:RCC1 domain-containing protein n=1 Tax=Plesiocystis pacifica TaxID=191768 RepID=UPI0018DC6F74|nr:hypothetical protein [Plesiocystis pacifica]